MNENSNYSNPLRFASARSARGQRHAREPTHWGEPAHEHDETPKASPLVGPFAKATGLTYHGVGQRYQNGKLDARQGRPGARGTINGEALDRYLLEGTKNRW